MVEEAATPFLGLNGSKGQRLAFRRSCVQTRLGHDWGMRFWRTRWTSWEGYGSRWDRDPVRSVSKAASQGLCPKVMDVDARVPN